MASIPALPVLEKFIEEGTPKPNADEIKLGRVGYRNYLTRVEVLDTEFRFDEIVDDKQGDKQMPRSGLWHRMALTLAAVQVLREAWGKPVTVIAAYRPGNVGAANSQHKGNAALDIDFYSKKKDELQAWFLLATKFWCHFGPKLKMGFGLYTGAPKSLGGNRVHVDTGWRGRTWQGVYDRGFMKPWIVANQPAQLSVKLAYDNKWDVPTREDI